MKQDEQRMLLFAGAASAALAVWTLMRKYQSRVEEPVKVGLIGTGWAVKVQLPQWRRAGLNVTAIASRKEANAIPLAAEHHIDYPYGTTQALCESKAVDIVSIVTPTYLHSKQMIEALQAGKHVVVEKPMALDGSEGERMLAAASQHNTQVAIVDHELRFTPAFQRARALLRAGDIGAVLAVDASTYLEARPGPWSWWHDAECGGGILGATASHLIDACRFLLDCEFVAVAAHLETLEKERVDPATDQPRACTSDDYASLQFRLSTRRDAKSAAWDAKSKDCIPGRIAVGKLGRPPPAASHFSIIGSRGLVSLDPRDSSMIARDDSGKVFASVSAGANAYTVTGTHAMGVALQSALGPRGDTSALEPAATIRDGLAVVHVLDAVRVSSQHGGLWQTPKAV